MSISEKIESIRQKPEHIRIRYVWSSVAISMVVILAIWLFSFNLFSKEKIGTETESMTGSFNLEQQLQNTKDQMPSLEDSANTPLRIGEESKDDGLANNEEEATNEAAGGEGIIVREKETSEKGTDKAEQIIDKNTEDDSETIKSGAYSDLPDTNAVQ